MTSSDPLQKTWGWSTRVFCNEHVQLERIFIRAGGYSSIHLHEQKHNQFIVSEGKLVINFFKDEKCSHQEIVPVGESLSVPPQIQHQFLAHTVVHGYEFYWAKSGMLNPNDIVRFTHNGLDDNFRLPISEEPFRYCFNCNKPYETHLLMTVTIENAIRDICPKCLPHTTLQI